MPPSVDLASDAQRTILLLVADVVLDKSMLLQAVRIFCTRFLHCDVYTICMHNLALGGAAFVSPISVISWSTYSVRWLQDRRGCEKHTLPGCDTPFNRRGLSTTNLMLGKISLN